MDRVRMEEGWRSDAGGMDEGWRRFKGGIEEEEKRNV